MSTLAKFSLGLFLVAMMLVLFLVAVNLIWSIIKKDDTLAPITYKVGTIAFLLGVGAILLFMLYGVGMIVELLLRIF